MSDSAAAATLAAAMAKVNVSANADGERELFSLYVKFRNMIDIDNRKRAQRADAPEASKHSAAR